MTSAARPRRPARRRSGRQRAAAAALLSTAVAATAACAAADARPGGSAPAVLPVVVSVPQTALPWVAGFAAHGAGLAVAELNAAGGVLAGGVRHRLRLEVRDNGGSPQAAVGIARAAVREHALAVVTDGTGAAAAAAVTDPANLPVFVVFDGGGSITDPAARPTVFRIAPADAPMARRLADYLAARVPSVALLSTDARFGADGRAALRAALRVNRLPVRADAVVPAGSTDLTPQVLAARARGARALVVWADAPVTAAAVRAARAAGWAVPVFTAPTGEDPQLRQLLADHPGWVDGLTFVSFRITSEVGAAPFAAFRARYESRFGVERVVGGVTSPPDWAMYGYDAVRLAATAYTAAGSLGSPLLTQLDTVAITGANGDERGFTATVREGVVPDDMYFGRFHGLRFSPVTDDLLGPTLPTVPQG